MVTCDVSGVEADLGALDALAHLQLAALRAGCRIRLRNANGDLAELVRLAGLSEVLPG
jgi:ABC-type transporter Mla MlaB component